MAGELDVRLSDIHCGLAAHTYALDGIALEVERMAAEDAQRDATVLSLETTFTSLISIINCTTFVDSVLRYAPAPLPQLTPPVPPRGPVPPSAASDAASTVSREDAEGERKETKKKGGILEKFKATLNEAADSLNDQYDEYLEKKRKAKAAKAEKGAARGKESGGTFAPAADGDPTQRPRQPQPQQPGGPVWAPPPVHPAAPSVKDWLLLPEQQQYLTARLEEFRRDPVFVQYGQAERERQELVALGQLQQVLITEYYRAYGTPQQ